MSNRYNDFRIENPIGDSKVMIFDVDYCLYHSDKLAKHEYEYAHKLYLKTRKNRNSVFEFSRVKYNLFAELFYKESGIHPVKYFGEHDVPDFHKFIDPDNDLREVLQSINIRKFCFTNGSAERVKTVLKHLNLDSGVFEGVICSDDEDTEFISKPKQESYKFVEKILGINDPKNIIFFDDSIANIQGAIKAGWNAYIIQRNIKEVLKKFNSGNLHS